MKPRATIVAHLDCDRERARRCLLALAALDPEPAHEVIVVDDAAPGLEPLLAALEGDVEIIRNEARHGFLESAARAAELARGEVLVLLQGAPELEQEALGPLVDALAEPGPGAVMAALPDAPGADPVAGQALALRRTDAGRLGRAERPVSARAEPGTAAELTIVIPTLDAASERVRSCLRAIGAATEAPHQIVLVDNGAPPQGFTAPVNAGLRAAATPYAVVMNDDVEVLPGWWPPLRAALDGGAEVAFPLTVEGGMRTDFAAWCFAIDQGTIAAFGHAPGEFFDPALRVWYQDTDLLERLRAAGNPPLLVRESRIRHGLSLTVGSEDPQLRDWVRETVRADRAAFVAKHPSVAAVAAP